jgi:hypothetical protein
MAYGERLETEQKTSVPVKTEINQVTYKYPVPTTHRKNSSSSVKSSLLMKFTAIIPAPSDTQP